MATNPSQIALVTPSDRQLPVRPFRVSVGITLNEVVRGFAAHNPIGEVLASPASVNNAISVLKKN